MVVVVVVVICVVEVVIAIVIIIIVVGIIVVSVVFVFVIGGIFFIVFSVIEVAGGVVIRGLGRSRSSVLEKVMWRFSKRSSRHTVRGMDRPSYTGAKSNLKRLQEKTN